MALYYPQGWIYNPSGVSQVRMQEPQMACELNICVCRGCLIFLEMNWHFGQEGCFSLHQSLVSLSSDSLWISLEATSPGFPRQRTMRVPGQKCEGGTCFLDVFQPQANEAVLCVMLLSFVKTSRDILGDRTTAHNWVMRIWKHSQPTGESTERISKGSFYSSL